MNPSPALAQTSPVSRWSEIGVPEKKAGLAAWLGWLFDGLDMHLFTLVALPFVAELMHESPASPAVSVRASIIQAAFLTGWALGGAFFGRIGDRLGRSRTLCLTVLTYAAFTGLSFFAQTWWQLMLLRFIAALGIGGEWAVGASLVAETWPVQWRPWLAAILQTAVNFGFLLACLAGWLLEAFPYRVIFLVGVLPAFITLWIRHSVPEPAEWTAASQSGRRKLPGMGALFEKPLRRTTLIAAAVCALGLTGHWALMFWHSAHLRSLAREAGWTKGAIDSLANQALYLITMGSLAGNFLAAWVAKRIGYRRTIGLFFLAYFLVMMVVYGHVRDAQSILFWLPILGVLMGVFGLFTMCLPPLFPTLVRTTGAGFCYNFGRIFAAAGTVVFGLFAKVGTGSGAICDHRLALLYAGCLFLPAALVAWFWMPENPATDSAAQESAAVAPAPQI